jgi:hypothetical protein
MKTPTPFQRVLNSTALTYQDWWYCMKYCRTYATANKLINSEHARIAKGCTTNNYGDLTSHDASLIRIPGRHGIGRQFTILHGFNYRKRRHYPVKTMCWVTTPLLDAITRARNLANALEETDRQQLQARKQGFISVKAMLRNEQQLAAIRRGCEHLFAQRKKDQEHRLLTLIHTLDQIRTGKVAVEKLQISDIDNLLILAEKEIAAARASLTLTFATLGKRKLAS